MACLSVLNRLPFLSHRAAIQLWEKAWTLTQRIVLKHQGDMQILGKNLRFFPNALSWHEDGAGKGHCVSSLFLSFLNLDSKDSTNVKYLPKWQVETVFCYRLWPCNLARVLVYSKGRSPVLRSEGSAKQKWLRDRHKFLCYNYLSQKLTKFWKQCSWTHLCYREWEEEKSRDCFCFGPQQSRGELYLLWSNLGSQLQPEGVSVIW